MFSSAKLNRILKAAENENRSPFRPHFACETRARNPSPKTNIENCFFFKGRIKDDVAHDQRPKGDQQKRVFDFGSGGRRGATGGATRGRRTTHATLDRVVEGLQIGKSAHAARMLNLSKSKIKKN